MLLAHKGYRVLLVDKAGFPSDHMSTHMIYQPAVARLQRWGLRERLAATGCPPITSITMDLGPFALRGTPPPAGQDLVWDGERVSGITGRSATGTTVSEQARIVIGADGLHSLIARQVEAPTYNAKPTFGCGYYSYWSGVPLSGVELYPRAHRVCLALPTHHGLVVILVGWPHKDLNTDKQR
jgi:2-polyprenyl-6-methoxyphenol hydroxylase-like FAD-dependent oxidoreductase